MRFMLVDKITALEAGESVSAIKNLSLAEEYLADHFPGFPVMPGVMMVESLVQASAWLMRYTEDFKYSTILLKKARAVKFNSFVVPGKTLSVTVTVRKWGDNEVEVKCTSTVDGATAVSARLTLEQFNLSDNNPELADSDAMRIGHFKELFSQLWTPDSL